MPLFTLRALRDMSIQRYDRDIVIRCRVLGLLRDRGLWVGGTALHVMCRDGPGKYSTPLEAPLVTGFFRHDRIVQRTM